ncbi:RRM domain-containing protein [Meloidogyne graminicola]|uniref:RRM domain-containing protein n=1 Tax=Meloidogyne graminicola TaxID=189291 RepID=A0A8T0A250_9BILA|nr:RRM domain-containing protein [Meloidogyne graminicola]
MIMRRDADSYLILFSICNFAFYFYIKNYVRNKRSEYLWFWLFRAISYETNSKDPVLLRARVFVGNMNPKVGRDEIIQLFRAYGTLVGVTVFKGYAFVQFSQGSEADLAVSALNGYTWHGSPLGILPNCKLASTGFGGKPLTVATTPGIGVTKGMGKRNQNGQPQQVPSTDVQTKKMKNTQQETPEIIDVETPETVIQLNVGGTSYLTMVETLKKDKNSLLAQILTPEGLEANSKVAKRLDNGTLFIDRDGKLFAYILDFLRNGKLLLPENFHEMARFKEEVQFYQIEELIQQLIKEEVVEYAEN